MYFRRNSKKYVGSTNRLFGGGPVGSSDGAPLIPGAFPQGLPSAQPFLARPRPPGLEPVPHALRAPGLRVLGTQPPFEITNSASARDLYLLYGMDLGVPVEHNGHLLLFFGDAKRYPTFQVADDKWVRPMATAIPVPGGLALDYLVDASSGRVASFDVQDVDNQVSDYWIGRAKLTPPPVRKRVPGVDDPRDNQLFDVPTGAFSHRGRLHVFRMRKTGFPGIHERSWSARYYPTSKDYGLGVIGGRSVLESASDPLRFADTAAVEVCDIRRFALDKLPEAWKFSHVCPQVVSGAILPELDTNGDVLLLWGTGAYRQSDVCFAWVPLSGELIPPQSEWRYFSGFSGGPRFNHGEMLSAIGLLTWSDRSIQSNVTSYERTEYSYRPFGTPRRGWAHPDPPSVGEFSVTYIPAFGAWLMLTTGHDTVLARLATKPWGPWGEPAVLLYVRGLYSPLALPTLTRWDAPTQSVELSFLGSFLPPGTHGRVMLYRTRLQLDTSLSRVIPPGIIAPLGRL